MNLQNQIEVRLVDDDNLWRRLAAHTNEMVIDKNGRLMFPTLDYKIRGLEAQKKYEFVLEFHQIGEKQYAFEEGKWVERGISAVSSQQANQRATKIRRGKQTGKYWMKNGVSFEHIRFTNQPTTNPPNITLSSMHKYHPVMTIYEVSSSLIPVEVVKVDHTEFIAVTTIRNPKVNDLKIENNPMSARRKKRRESSSSGNVSSSQPKKKNECDVVPPAPAADNPQPAPIVVPQLISPNIFLAPILNPNVLFLAVVFLVFIAVLFAV